MKFHVCTVTLIEEKNVPVGQDAIIFSIVITIDINLKEPSMAAKCAI